MQPFKPGQFYRTFGPEGLVGEGRPFRNYTTMRKAIERGELSPGRLNGGVRQWTGDELLAWWEARPRAPMKLPTGFGGPQPNTGQRHKQAADQPKQPNNSPGPHADAAA
jgi:hypothetical protein